MIDLELIGQLREKLGSLSVNDVDNTRLRDGYITPALVWLAGELNFNVRQEDNAIGLVAGQIEYPLMSDVLSVIWCEWNERRLEPASLTRSDREQDAWDQRASGTPAQFAIQGRKLAILPPPTAASIVTDPYVALRYIATPGPVGVDGPQGLSELDQWLVIYMSAMLWCETNLSEANATRLVNYTARVAEMLPAAKARWSNQADLYQQEFRLDTSHWRGTPR